MNQSVLKFLSKQKTSATPETKTNGERIIKKSELGETQYVSANYIVRNKTVISKHVFAGNQRIASTVSMKNNCGTMTEQNTMYFHPDHLGSSSYVTDKKGNFFEMIEYLPYGETLYDEAATVDKTEFRFTGHLKDDETGFYYCHARYYDAKIGRFISTDPILEMYLQGKPNDGVYRSINNDLYRYAANNPIMYNDPDGMADKVERKYNGSFLEEKPIKPIRPSTGILPVYDEKKPNEFGDRGKIQGSTNCTAYALNYIRNPVTKKEFGNSESLNNFGWQPGMFAEKRLPPSFDYVGNILADAKKVGISMNGECQIFCVNSH